MNSTLNPVSPFDILMVRYWKGQDAVNGLNQPEDTQSGYQTCIWAELNLYPPMTQK